MAIAYFEQYPDVGASYAQNSYGLTPEQYANFHFENYGRNEQRISPQVAEIAVDAAAASGTALKPTYTPVAAAYFQQNPDVAQAYQENNYGLTPDEFAATHYNLYGGSEQRAEPTIVEQITSGNLTALPTYFQQNPDVAAAYKLNTYGLTPEQFAAKHFELYGKTEKRVPPTGVTTGTTTGTITTPRTITPTTVVPTTVAPVTPNPITTPTVPVGQFRELFPSFEESKRLAGQMVANRPSTQSIINMIQTPQSSNALPAYFTQNPDVAAAYQQNNYGLTPEQFALTHYQRYGQTEQRAAPVGITTTLPAYFTQNPDVAAAYTANNYGLSPIDFANTHYNLYGQAEQRTAPTGTTTTPSLNNVLSMISK